MIDNSFTYKPFEYDTYQPLNKNILQELKRIIIEEKYEDQYKDNNYISLYDITTIMNKYHKLYNTTKTMHYNAINNKLKEQTQYTHIENLDFNYKDQQLIITLKTFNKQKVNLVYKKDKDDLYIYKATRTDLNKYNPYRTLALIGPELNHAYDAFNQYTEVFTKNSLGINSINSDFKIDINCKNISIYIDSIHQSNIKDFELTSIGYTKNNGKKEYLYNFNSTTAYNILYNNEDEVFKRILIDINDCPKWMIPELRKQKNKNQHNNKTLKKTKEN